MHSLAVCVTIRRNAIQYLMFIVRPKGDIKVSLIYRTVPEKMNNKLKTKNLHISEAMVTTKSPLIVFSDCC